MFRKTTWAAGRAGVAGGKGGSRENVRRPVHLRGGLVRESNTTDPSES